MLVLAVLGVLDAGVSTPSEAAGVGVVLVLLLVGVAYRGLGARQFVKVLLETTNQSPMILMIVAFSAVIATMLSCLRVPHELAGIVTEMDLNRWVIMVIINIVLLVLGCFLPLVFIIVMVMPVLMGALPYVGVLSVSIVLFSLFPSLVTGLPGLLY